VLHNPFGIALESGARNLAQERHAAAFHFEGKIIENSVIRKHHEFVPDFPLKAVLGDWGGKTPGGEQRGESQITEHGAFPPTLWMSKPVKSFRHW
jgi:hypothetical protein